ncbi:hypothetical protein QTP88_005658 [Uroleucon formosanum]
MSFQSKSNGSKYTNKRNLSYSSLSPKTEENKSKFFCTPNRYSTLAKDDDIDNNSSSNIGQYHKSSEISNLPPVYIKDVSDISSFTSSLLSILKPSDFICKSIPSHLIVRTQFREHYNLLLTHLMDTDANFHTYQPKVTRPLRVVIRNLHPTTSHEDIIAGLSDLGHHVSNVHNIKRFSDKTPLPLFFVDINSDTNNLDIYKIQFLLNTKIVVEKPHPRKGPPQCHICQTYGHTRSYCHYVPRCVKCGEEHLSVSCNKSKDSPAKCALCSGDHTANFKGCPAYKKLNKNKPKISPKTPPTVFPDAQAKPKARSYAEAAANNNSTADIITTVLSQFITNLNSVIGPLISLLTKNPILLTSNQKQGTPYSACLESS